VRLPARRPGHGPGAEQPHQRKRQAAHPTAPGLAARLTTRPAGNAAAFTPRTGRRGTTTRSSPRLPRRIAPDPPAPRYRAGRRAKRPLWPGAGRRGKRGPAGPQQASGRALPTRGPHPRQPYRYGPWPSPRSRPKLPARACTSPGPGPPRAAALRPPVARCNGPLASSAHGNFRPLPRWRRGGFSLPQASRPIPRPPLGRGLIGAVSPPAERGDWSDCLPIDALWEAVTASRVYGAGGSGRVRYGDRDRDWNGSSVSPGKRLWRPRERR